MKNVACILAVALALAGCGRGDGSAETPPDTLLSPFATPADAPAGSAPAPRGSPVFRPDSVEAGDTIAGLVVESADIARSFPDGEWIGTVRFAGQVTVSGITRPHPDGDESPALCFELDRESTVRLPRFAGDERIGWFCFENPDDARRQLAALPTRVRASIVIDRYSYVWAHSDVVNGGRLARVVVKTKARR
jgi:hypothetical protein